MTFPNAAFWPCLIPGPCCNNPFGRDPEGALFGHHQGITGVRDLDPARSRLARAAARFTIGRMS